MDVNNEKAKRAAHEIDTIISDIQSLIYLHPDPKFWRSKYNLIENEIDGLLDEEEEDDQ